MRGRMIVGLGAVVVLVAACGGGKRDNADSVTGPGISVHCAGAVPQGNGDTSVHVTCPGTAAEEPQP